MEAVKLALELGADVNQSCNKLQESILTQSDNPEIVKLLLAAGADPNGGNSSYKPIQKLAKNPESLRLILAAGADPETKGYQDETVLYKILTDSSGDLSKRRECAQILIQAGANINHKATRRSPRTEQFPEGKVVLESVLEFLVRMTSDGNESWGKDYIDSLKLALELGANVNVLCEDNKKLSDQTQNQEVIDILKAAGIQC